MILRRLALALLALAPIGCLAPTPQGPRLAEPAHAPSGAPGDAWPERTADPPGVFERPEAEDEADARG